MSQTRFVCSLLPLARSGRGSHLRNVRIPLRGSSASANLSTAAESSGKSSASNQSVNLVDKSTAAPSERNAPAKKPQTIAERDAAMMNAWKDREGSLANAEFEDGQVEGGYRRNVKANIFRYI